MQSFLPALRTEIYAGQRLEKPIRNVHKSFIYAFVVFF